MPRFSVVVPVFQVDAYLADCLDSIIGQSFEDVEILAVDDGSTDDSGRILDAYARKDDRITAVHFPENRGIGRARNEGLEHASGEYLLFVDSDDRVPPGAFASIERRLRETGDPEILVYDFAAFRPGGSPERNGFPDGVLDGGPAVFELAQNPDVLRIPFASWNKAHRRDFVTRHGFRFPLGYYEDVLWSCRNLLTARHIALHDAVCLHYRWDRPGSITAATDDKRLDLFSQYERILEFIGDRPQLLKWRAKVLEISVVGLQAQVERISPQGMVEFHRRSAELYSGHPDMLMELQERVGRA